MMSLQTIKDLAAQAGREAAKNGKVPYSFWDNQIEDMKTSIKAGRVPAGIRALPNLGDHVPDGYELEDELFVDATGMGYESEPALTVRAFIDQLRSDRSYAITQTGQFQVYVGVFKKTRGDV